MRTGRAGSAKWTPKSLRRGLAQGTVDAVRGSAAAAADLHHYSLLRSVMSGEGKQRWRSLRGLLPYQVTRLEDYVRSTGGGDAGSAAGVPWESDSEGAQSDDELEEVV